MASEEAEIKELSKKLAQNPDSMVFVQLADAYRRAKDLEHSVEVCQQGLERHPTYTTARAILGRNFLDLGRLEDAEAEFRKIEVADPENIMAHRMLGQIFMQKGQYGEAIQRQQRVLSLDPEDGTAQELLQEALTKSKEAPSGKETSPPKFVAPKGSASSDQSGTIKVAEIYIKKGAFDEAAEVLQEVLATDPDNALARQKLQEVNERRGIAGSTLQVDEEAEAKVAAAAKAKFEEEAKAKAAAEVQKKAEEEAILNAEARRRAEEAEARAKVEADARKKAEEEAKAKADADLRKKAEDEARAKSEADARKRAEDEAEADARKKAEEAALAEAQRKTEALKRFEEEARQKAEVEAKAKAAVEEAAALAEAQAAERKKAEDLVKRAQEEKESKASKLSSDDILSVMTSSSDDLIDEPRTASPSSAAVATAKTISPEARVAIDNFIRAQAMEASMLLDAKGTVLESKVKGDAAVLGSAAGAIFSNTEKAAQRMAFGGLRQIMIVGEDGRQILFVALKAGVLVALTGRNTNLGLLRVALNDLVKRA